MFGRIIDYHTKSEQRTIGVLLDKNLILHFIFHSQFILSPLLQDRVPKMKIPKKSRLPVDWAAAEVFKGRNTA